MRLTTIVFGLSVVACGSKNPGTQPDAAIDSIFNPGGGSDPGTGTATLVVTGTVSARAMVNNSSDPSTFTTEITVHVTTPAAVEITTGTVTVTSVGGAV